MTGATNLGVLVAVLKALEPTAATLKSRADYAGWMESVSAAGPFVESLMDLIPAKATVKKEVPASGGAETKMVVVDKKAARG